MKKIILSVLSSWVFFPGIAQYVSARKEITHYVFPDFIQGTVLKKSNQTVSTRLNYNTLTEEMIFMDFGKPMALDEPENVDTVYIENKRFIPVGKVYYEVATHTPISLFIQYKTKLIPPGKNAGFGTSQVSSITSVANILGPGGAYQLALPDDFKIIPKTTYWLKKTDQYIKVDNVKEILAMFPEKANLIKEFIKENKLRFERPEDVTRIILFCN